MILQRPSLPGWSKRLSLSLLAMDGTLTQPNYFVVVHASRREKRTSFSGSLMLQMEDESLQTSTSQASYMKLCLNLNRTFSSLQTMIESLNVRRRTGITFIHTTPLRYPVTYA